MNVLGGAFLGVFGKVEELGKSVGREEIISQPCSCLSWPQ